MRSIMRTTGKTIVRRGHWRWQRCGIGCSELRRVHVRETSVTLGPTDTRQMDLLERLPVSGERRSRRRQNRRHTPAEKPRPVIRSYWRNQPFGPESRLRKLVLVDVTR